MRTWVKRSTWLCLSLLLWTMALESTHHHPTQTEAASCSICVVAHSATPTISSSHAAPVFAAVGRLFEEDVIAKAQFDLSEQAVRGPPVL